MKQKHIVRTYNLSGKFIHEETFNTAEEAYEEYRDTIENLREHLPQGYGVNVVRFNDGHMMAMETIVGVK